MSQAGVDPGFVVSGAEFLGSLNSEYKIGHGSDYLCRIKKHITDLKKLTVITQTRKIAQYFYQLPA